jgi:hypothetical protein
LPPGNGRIRIPWQAPARLHHRDAAWLTVVGIAPDIAQKDMRNVTPGRHPTSPFDRDPQRSAVILAHTRVAPASRRSLPPHRQSLDKDLPARDVARSKISSP